MRREPTAGEVVRAFRRAEWADRGFFAAVTCGAVLLVAGAVWTAQGAFDAVKAVTAGVPGSVAVRDCTVSSSVKDPRFWTTGWDCSGTFTAADGSLRLGRVDMFLHAAARPGPRVPARVSGPQAGWAVPDGDHEWVFAVLLVAGLSYLAARVVRGSIELIEPVEGWPRPAKRRPVVPQIGNRARRRRR